MEATGSLLVIGTDVANIHLCLLESISGIYRLVYWQEADREPGRRTVQQIRDLCQAAENSLGRRVWNAETETPYHQSEDPLRFPPISHIFVASSPWPRLRVFLAGISRSYSLHAAHLAVQSSPAQIEQEVTLQKNMSGTALHELLSTGLPDVLILTGGFDVPDPLAYRPIVKMSTLLSEAMAQMAPVQRPTLLYSGNRWATPEIKAIFDEGELLPTVEILPNVQPHTQRTSPVSLIYGLTVEHWRRCRRTSEYREMSRWVQEPAQLASLESNFARLTQAWMRYQQLAELHGLYQGPDWWMHVRARKATDTVEIAFSVPNEPTSLINSWPNPQLISGPWPLEVWVQPEISWCDRLGLAPMIAAVGHSYPRAMLQVLETDIFRT